jgi:hypothetical protein
MISRMKKLFIWISVCFSFLANSQTQPAAVQPVSILQVPVISITEFNRPITTQTQRCLPTTDPSAPMVEGAISSSQGCVTSSTTEVVRAFKVVYEFSGRQYAVELPENPGPYIQLQITSRPSQNALIPEGIQLIGALPTVIDQSTLTTTALAYPYVYYSGAMYRPMPFFIGASYRTGGGYRMGRGRRH